MSTTSLDDILLNSLTKTQPPAKEPDPAVEVTEDVSRETLENPVEVNEPDEYGASEEAPPPAAKVMDEYGNEKAPTKVYTEDEVNDRINSAIRDRLARMERNHSPAPTQQQAQQAASGFEYNAESKDTWQAQLESFVEQTVSKMSTKQAYQSLQAREQAAQAEFESKFTQGMGKFSDFKDVVGSQPISDDMVRAARTMKDPAAFFYAAAKRAPQDLQRIANLQDPYAQIAEIAKLEERMKQAKPNTAAPRPVSRVSGDADIPRSNKKEMTIEEMIQADANRRLALQKKRKG